MRTPLNLHSYERAIQSRNKTVFWVSLFYHRPETQHLIAVDMLICHFTFTGLVPVCELRGLHLLKDVALPGLIMESR